MSKSAFNPPIPIAPKPVSILIIYTILDRDCLGKKYITLPRLDEENLRKVEDVIMEKCHINGDTFGTIVNIIRLDN